MSERGPSIAVQNGHSGEDIAIIPNHPPPDPNPNVPPIWPLTLTLTLTLNIALIREYELSESLYYHEALSVIRNLKEITTKQLINILVNHYYALYDWQSEKQNT